MSDKRLIGESALKMFYIAKREGISGIDFHTRLQALMKEYDWATRGIAWCIERNYLTDAGITKRGLRYAKKIIKEDGQEYKKLKNIMLEILNSGAEKNEC